MATKNRTSTSRTRGKKAVVVPTESADNRIFRALQERPYAVPQLKFQVPNQSSKRQHRFPAFVDSKGNLYDIDYLPISSSDLKPAPQSNLSLEQKLAFDTNSTIWDKMPRANDFDNFFRYEQALLEWKVNAQIALGSLQLPSVMGRHYYRPRVVLERTRGVSVSNDYLPNPEEISKEQEDRLSNEDEELYTNFAYRNEVTKKQFAKLLEKKRSTILQLDDNKHFKLIKDVWDSNLIPQEPDPTFYDTYEDYALAMKRWASLCASQTQIIPPHATQLKDLIPIQTAETETKEDLKETVSLQEEEKEEVVEKIVNGLYETHFFPDFVLSYPPAPRRIESFQGVSPIGSISPEVKGKIQEFFETLLKNQMDKHDKLKSFNRPIFPVIHGTFPKPNVTGVHQKLKATQKNKILRKTDLTGPMINSCYDCPGEVEGKRVEFKFPEFDLETILYSKLQSDPKYREQTKLTLRQTQYSDRNDYLNGWYFPTFPKEIHAKHRAQVDEILLNIPSDKITIPHIISVLETPMLLDKFQDLLAESMPEGSDGVVRTYLQAFLNVVTPENFHEVLVLFEKHSSRMIHAKLSVFVSETLQSSRAKIILEKLIFNRDVRNLGFVAYAMQFFNDVPVEIYPYNHQWTDLNQIINQLNSSIEPIIKVLLLHYYVHLVSETMTKHPFLFVAINQFVTESRKSTAFNLISLLEQNPTFLSKDIWAYMGHRSSTISAFFLFIFIRLLNNRDSAGFKEMLTSENTHFLDNLKKLSLSKYSHTQYAVKRIYRKLLTEPWEDWLYAIYNTNNTLLIEDLTLPRKKTGELSLYTELVLEMCYNFIEKITKANYSKNPFLLRESFFHGTLDIIVKSQKQVDQTTEALCILLGTISKVFFKLGLIKAVESIKGSSRNLNSSELSITPGDLQKLISLVSEMERRDRTSPEKKYVAKRHILICLRHLIKPPAVWEFLKKEGIFFSTILGFCRDGKDKEFNAESWRTLYQIILYHHGVLEYLIKQNILGHFIELVGTSSAPLVMINGLHYITKLFSMPTTQQRRLAEGKYEIRSEIPKESFKTFEKDTKKLNSFFVDKSLFIKVHMIYKKITPSHQQGLTFLELAQFYHTLTSVPTNSKLYKDTTKKAEYKAGLQSIQVMFSPDAPEEMSPGSSIKKATSSVLGKEKFSKLLASSRGSHKE